MDNPSELIKAKQLAEELQVGETTLAQWRMTEDQGPRFIKLGRSVRYRRSDIESWLESRTRTVVESSDG